MKNISQPSIRSLRIQLPPLPQQRKIARILTTLDNVITQTEALIAKYQAIKQGLMHDLFTRGVDATGKLRPPQSEAPELYKQSELGWIPKEWEVSELGDFLTSIDAGWSPECIEVPPSAGEWGVLKVSAVTSGKFVAAESKTLPKHLQPDLSIEVKVGDVLLARSNGVAELVGVTVQVLDVPDKLMLSDKVLRLNPKKERLTNEFLASTMKTEGIRKQVGQVISGSSGQRNVSQVQIRTFRFVAPPVDEQRRISARIDAIQMQCNHETNACGGLRELKTGLMQDLLTGKVRVNAEV